MAEEKVEELTAEVAGQKLSLKSVALNTLATVATLIAVGVLLTITWIHHTDGREGRNEFISALKEQTAAQRENAALQREQNCLFKFKPEERHQWADTCKTTSGAPR